MTGTAITTLTDLLRMKPTSASIRISCFMFMMVGGLGLGSPLGWPSYFWMWIYLFIWWIQICVDLAKKLVGDAAESGLLACLNSNYLLIKSAKIARTVIADA